MKWSIDVPVNIGMANTHVLFYFKAEGYDMGCMPKQISLAVGGEKWKTVKSKRGSQHWIGLWSHTWYFMEWLSKE